MHPRLRNARRALLIPGLLAFGLVAPAPIVAGDPCFHGFEMPPASSSPGTDIKLLPCSFEPTVTFVAPEAGIYPYACALHVGMSGAIVVGDVAAGLGAGTGRVSGGQATPPGAVAPAGQGAPDPEAAAQIAAAEAAAAASLAEASASAVATTALPPVELIAIGIGGLLLFGVAGLGLAYRRRGDARPLVRAD
jgi:hypothetical protein